MAHPSEPAKAPAADVAFTGALAAPPPVLGRAWDFLLLGPGATVLVSGLYALLMVMHREGAAISLATTLSLVVLGPHYAATYRRAYASAEILRAHPLVTVVAPIGLVAAAALAVRSPRDFGPFYFLAYVAWSGYHYSGQSLGVAMLYPLRQRARLDAREKRLLALPLYVSWLVSLVGLMQAGAAARNPAYGIVRDTFAPASLPQSTLAIGLLLVPLLASFAGPAVVARERRRRGLPLPRECYGVIAAQVLWFGCGLFFPFFSVVLVPVFHSLQYLALTGWHHTRGARGLGSFTAYVLVVLAVGLAINPGLLIVFVPRGASTQTVAAAVISAVNLHHFLMDGRIWRLRERRVAQSFVS
jgi:hypothetical protein